MDFTIDVFRNNELALNVPKDKHVIFWKRKFYQISVKITILSIGQCKVKTCAKR